MNALETLRGYLRSGKVYRREELAKWSTAVDRHLKALVDSKELRKLSGGLYYCPKETAFGPAPAQDTELVTAFLKDDRFLVTSPNAYNALGVGSTQLYNETVVYNHKRHGRFKLGERVFDFRVKPSFPRRTSREFLLVDLVNNVDRLAENQSEILDRVKKVVSDFDGKSLLKTAREYGSVRARKFFSQALSAETPSYHAR